MTATVFVDTNVLVYAHDRSEPRKHGDALRWMAAMWDARAGRLSYQVLNEYYVTATRRLDPAMSADDARDDVAGLISWRPVPVDLPVLDRARDIERRFGFSWWDSLILAAALVADCEHLLTEDLQEGQGVGGLTIISPFSHDPEDILRP